MRVLFHTNLDKYRGGCFPFNMTFVPRIGESVSVVNVFKEFFTKKRLPTTLVVTNVIYSEDCVVVELWYSKIDVEAAKLNNIELL